MEGKKACVGESRDRVEKVRTCRLVFARLCGQVDEDARTRLESGGCGGGCGQVDEDPRARLESGGCVGRSTKDPRARLRSGDAG